MSQKNSEIKLYYPPYELVLGNPEKFFPSNSGRFEGKGKDSDWCDRCKGVSCRSPRNKNVQNWVMINTANNSKLTTQPNLRIENCKYRHRHIEGPGVEIRIGNTCFGFAKSRA